MEYLPNHVHFDPYFDCPEATELITTEQSTPARRLLQAQLDELNEKSQQVETPKPKAESRVHKVGTTKTLQAVCAGRRPCHMRYCTGVLF